MGKRMEIDSDDPYWAISSSFLERSEAIKFFNEQKAKGHYAELVTIVRTHNFPTVYSVHAEKSPPVFTIHMEGEGKDE